MRQSPFARGVALLAALVLAACGGGGGGGGASTPPPAQPPPTGGGSSPYVFPAAEQLFQQALERAATIQTILTALQSLPANQREIIILREIEQLSYEQISKVIGCSAASMRVTLFRARKRFVERAEALLKETDK